MEYFTLVSYSTESNLSQEIQVKPENRPNKTIASTQLGFTLLTLARIRLFFTKIHRVERYRFNPIAYNDFQIIFLEVSSSINKIFDNPPPLIHGRKAVLRVRAE